MADPGVKEADGFGSAARDEDIRSSLRIFKDYQIVFIGKDALGRNIYKVSGLTPEGIRIGRTVTYHRGQVDVPDYRHRERQPRLDGRDPQAQDGSTPLQTDKDKAMAWITIYTPWIDPSLRTRYTSQISEYSGDRAGFYRMFETIRQSVGAVAIGEATYIPPPIDYGLGGLGGGGGGFTGPEYRAPDERVVTDFVTGNLVALIGDDPDSLVERFTALYMTDHKRNFESLDAEIDPAQSVTEAIRGTSEYQRIHKLRPEGSDERQWISARRIEGQRAGLAEGQLDEFAIDQASGAGDLVDLAGAGAARQFQQSGQAPAFLDQKFRAAAESMLKGVRR